MACPLARLIKLVLNGLADDEVVVALIVPLGLSGGTGANPREREFTGMKMMKSIKRERAFMVRRTSFRTTCTHFS